MVPLLSDLVTWTGRAAKAERNLPFAQRTPATIWIPRVAALATSGVLGTIVRLHFYNLSIVWVEEGAARLIWLVLSCSGSSSGPDSRRRPYGAGQSSGANKGAPASRQCVAGAKKKRSKNQKVQTRLVPRKTNANNNIILCRFASDSSRRCRR